MKNLREKRELIEQILIKHYLVEKAKKELINLKQKLEADLIWNDLKSSLKIKTSLGTIRVQKSKKKYQYLLATKEFEKLDYSLQKEFFIKKLTRIIFKINQSVFEDSLQKKTVPTELKNLVVQKETKPFTIFVLNRHNEEIENKILNQAKMDDKDLEYEESDDDYEEVDNEFDPAYFEDDELNDVSEEEREYKGI